MNCKTIEDFNFKNKKVLLRLDLNVPIIDNVITSSMRIDEALPTIKKLISEDAKIIIFSHLGRIKLEADKKKHSLLIVAKEISKKLNQEIIFINETRGKKLEAAINNLMPGQIVLVENTRYEDVHNNDLVMYESKNDPSLGKYWASLGDIFINDAFGTAHRSHASNVGIATYIKKSGIGYLIQKELIMLSKVLYDFKKPFISIIGGAKVSDKIGVLKNLLKISDKILIAGGMAYTFTYVLGNSIGNSLFEKDKVPFVRELMQKHGHKIVLPIDFAISKTFSNSKRQETTDRNIPKNYEGMDIGTKAIKQFTKIINNSKTIIWNGPMGVFEFSNYKKGTKEIAKAIVNTPNVFSIIGGGDSASAAINLGFKDKFSHISTGGGASLEFMEGKKLPAIEAIQKK